MKKPRALVLMKVPRLVVALLLVACPPAQGEAADGEPEFTNLIKALNTALMKADMPYLNRLLHKDFVLTNSQGKLEERAEYLENRKTGRVKYESKVSDEIKVRLYGDTAIVTGRDTETGKDHQGAMDGQFRWTRVFLRHNGHWQLAAVHFTPVQKP